MQSSSNFPVLNWKPDFLFFSKITIGHQNNVKLGFTMLDLVAWFQAEYSREWPWSNDLFLQMITVTFKKHLQWILSRFSLWPIPTYQSCCSYYVTMYRSLINAFLLGSLLSLFSFNSTSAYLSVLYNYSYLCEV